MTMAQLNAKIDALPPFDPHYTTKKPPLDRQLARYLRDERFGILCGKEEPTPEHILIVHDQLFKPPKQPELLK